jgi:transaldolase
MTLGFPHMHAAEALCWHAISNAHVVPPWPQSTNPTSHPETRHRSAGVADRLIVDIGCDLLKIVPGRVSTEVDAHFSHDAQATIDKGRRIAALYKERGVDPSRIYVKVASTWAGVQACKQLESEGINCNCTLIFSFAQVRPVRARLATV